MTGSKENEEVGGTAPKFGNKWNGLFKVEWRYRKWNQYCVSNPGGAVFTGETKWRPQNWTGGNEKYEEYDMWYCENRPSGDH
jgi:hypothetical protein